MPNRSIVSLFAGLCCLWGQAVFSQGEAASGDFTFSRLFQTESNPLSPIGIFSQDMPFYFRGNESGRNQLSVAYSMGNTWHPQCSILYPQNLTPQQRQEVTQIFMADRPAYFELNGIETKSKTFESDGVLQMFRLSYLHEWGRENSLLVNMNANLLSGGTSPVHFFASDRFIEFLHSKYFIEDNFGRRLFPFNRAFIQFEDEDGRMFRKNKGDVFLSVFDLHYFRQIWHYSGQRAKLSWQLGAHLNVPLNSVHPYLIPGISTGWRSDFLLGGTNTITVAADAGVSDQTFLRLGEGVRAIDWKYRKQAKLYLGYNFVSKRRNVTSIGILNNYQDPLLKGYYFTWNQTGYHDLGLKYLKSGDIWEGEQVPRTFHQAKLSAAALYYFSFKSYLILGFHKGAREFNIYIGEDLVSVNNAPDIQYGFQYRFPIGN